jgi:hypothetical protein
MAKKKDHRINLPGDRGNQFSETDYILNYKPTIDYVEPADQFHDDELVVLDPTLDDLRDRSQKLLAGYKNLKQLADLAGDKLDKRVKDDGGLTMELDPNIDAATISAIQRRFPDADPQKLTYDMYKDALKCLNSQAPSVPQVTAEDIKREKTNPLKTDFGGWNAPPGDNRIEKQENNVNPVDLGVFQSAATIALFALLLPMINSNTSAAIATHSVTLPHT